MAPSDPSLTRWHADALASYAEKLERHQAEDIVSVVPMPTYQPAFRGMIVDALGYLWIDLGYEEDVSRRRHLIVGPDLEPHGVMTLPDLELLEVGEDYVLATAWADSGTEQVVVYPLAR
ncbi:MAG: hypothetical protein KJO65_09585 [Gemmatimonadetes bacterium]|nr:hypothetical protein [Gemmatimonadota bacterium]